MYNQRHPYNMTLTSRYMSGTFWSLLGTLAARLGVLGAAVIAARLLGKVGFGELVMIQSTVGFMSTFAIFGLGLTTSKYVSEYRLKDHEKTGRIISLTNMLTSATGLLTAMGCIWAAPWLAASVLNAPHLTLQVRIGAAVLFFFTLWNTQNGTLAGLQAFKALANVNILQGLLMVGFTLFATYYWGLTGAVLALLIPPGVGVFLAARFIRRECSTIGVQLRFKTAWQESTALWKFSFPAFISGLMLSSAVFAANAILVHQPQGYGELGLFNAANQFRMILMFIPNVLGMVTIPILSELNGFQDWDKFSRVLGINLQLIWGGSLVAGFLLIGFIPWLLWVFGSQFQGHYRLVGFMVCAAMLNLAYLTVTNAMISSGRMWPLIWMNLAWAVCLLAGVSLLGPHWGGTGLALAYILGYAVAALLAFGYAAAIFGKDCVSHVTWLGLLNILMFLWVFIMDKIPEVALFCFSGGIGMVIGYTVWKKLPTQTKQNIRESFRLKILLHSQ